MHVVGASPFGTRFFEPESVLGTDGPKFHFRIRHLALNWSAQAMAQRLQLLSWSIHNVVGALRCLNGAESGSVSFSRPADPAAFDGAWNCGSCVQIQFRYRH